MQVRKIPSGYFEFSEGMLHIAGTEDLQIPVADIESADCREGKKLLLPSTPYGVFECVFRMDGKLVQRRMFFHSTDFENMRSLCHSIQTRLTDAA